MARARPPRSASSPSIWRMPALRCCWGGAGPFPPRGGGRGGLGGWGDGKRVGMGGREGGDPVAVGFDAVSAGKARGKDVVLVDTAGRLPTQLHLMQELAKIRRVIGKA